MVKENVPFDYIGLSYYPSRAVEPDGGWETLARYLAQAKQFGKRALVCEFDYPNQPVDGREPVAAKFPFTQEGQATWVRDFLAWAKQQPTLAGVFWFYPDHYPGFQGSSGACALFVGDGNPAPALAAFRRPSNVRPLTPGQQESAARRDP